MPQQLVVHLHPLHLLVALLQPLVVLPQLPDVVAGLGQDASFTLPATQNAKKGGVTTRPGIFTLKAPKHHTLVALTAPVLLSTLQSGMIFESVTIQLLILSLLLLSTAEFFF